MGKKMKLVLDDLKVKSFVTEVNDNYARNVKGGDTGFCTDTEPECCETGGTVSCGATCQTCNGCLTDDGTCYCTEYTDCTCIVATCTK